MNSVLHGAVQKDDIRLQLPPGSAEGGTQDIEGPRRRLEPTTRSFTIIGSCGLPYEASGSGTVHHSNHAIRSSTSSCLCRS